MKMTLGLRIAMMAFWAGQLGAAERTAESAWGELVGDSISRAAYAYVESDPALPNVFIYGDSISIGYTPGVREHLTGHANVYRLHLNGGHSASFVSKFKTLDSTMRDPALAGAWDFEWDVIHFNVGLHDLKYLNEANQLDLENGKQVTTIAEYQAHLRRIIDHLKQAAPRAKLIFALTTKVPAGAKGRIENSELAYNAAALAVLEDFPEIAINDLRTASLPYEQPGNVHFKASGLAAQAEHVAKVIKTHLP